MGTNKVSSKGPGTASALRRLRRTATAARPAAAASAATPTTVGTELPALCGSGSPASAVDRKPPEGPPSDGAGVGAGASAGAVPLSCFGAACSTWWARLCAASATGGLGGA
eukprot:CAMPEP_0171187818 /NCGR_PEP_ID=MMETSP0790-20130122/17515_1 /TAXON_ID=2925 /ORGANISM="Alexandrium catenella, Strain OF101" /LENGTH=110 /DNA_ID=CAMNT_0011652887 /DNA_START=471 /DNA_END=799 /DNA_ORIENTATION=+